MAKQKPCKHTNIIFTVKTTKIIPEGWERFNEQEDIDLEDYQTTQVTNTVFCEDCGEDPREAC